MGIRIPFGRESGSERHVGQVRSAGAARWVPLGARRARLVQSGMAQRPTFRDIGGSAICTGRLGLALVTLPLEKYSQGCSAMQLRVSNRVQYSRSSGPDAARRGKAMRRLPLAIRILRHWTGNSHTRPVLRCFAGNLRGGAYHETVAKKRGDRKDPLAVALGRRGGKATASKRTAAERSEAARRAVLVRWAREKARKKDSGDVQ